MSVPLAWKAIVKQVFGLDTEIQAVYFYESKKNQVSKLRLLINGERNEVIAKKYVWGDIDSEIAVIKKADGLELNVPQFLARFSDIAFFTPVPGRLLHNPLSEKEASLIGRWLSNFHEKMTPNRARGTFLRGDCTLKNFSFHEESNKIYALDFEQAYFGPCEDDLAELIVSMLSGAKADNIWHSPHLQAVNIMLRFYKRKFNVGFLYEEIIQGLINRMEFRREFMPEIQALAVEFSKKKQQLLELISENN
ncbi:MAG: DUF2252 family protein [Candidatus Bruticola sp.]